MKTVRVFLLGLALLAPTVTLAQMHNPPLQPHSGPTVPPLAPGGNPGYHFPSQVAPLPAVPQRRQQQCTTTYNPWTRQYQTTCY